MASPAQTATRKGQANLLIAGGVLKIPRDAHSCHNTMTYVVKGWRTSSPPIPPYWELTYMASPAQTVTGKDKSNPLIAGGLLKIPRDSNSRSSSLTLLVLLM